MAAFSSPELLRHLLTALESSEISLLCASSRAQREQFKFLHTFAVKFRRDIVVEEVAVESLQKAVATLSSLQSFAMGLAYQTTLRQSICQLSQSLGKHPLTSLTLDLRRCWLGDDGAQGLAISLSVLRLKHLDLRLSFNKISSRGANELSEALAPSLVDIVLHMDINLIGRSAPKLLCAVLHAQRAHIDLAHCGLGHVALQLADTLESHTSRSVKSQKLHIDLRGNDLADSKAYIIKAAACLNAAGCMCLIELD
mmetsp:Transcript_66125/g.137017  ORF Transcript_66125/g.137017 Transcript_66125/m.137017 type:complete len:254 (-) Transcript_66125:9-770(-)